MVNQRQLCWLCLVTLIALWVPTAGAQVIYFDDFDTFHDYTTGAVPAGGIWSGVHSPTKGGGFFNANGVSAGELYLDDLNTNINDPGADRPIGVGWESGLQNARWNNAPFLFRDVPSDRDFTATMKITSQSAGFFSYSSIIARRKGPTVGINDPGPLDANESFVATGSFPAIVAGGPIRTILTQRIVNAVETESPLVNSATAGAFPLWLRLSKVGSLLTCATSADGTTFVNHHLVTNVELDQTGETLEVGFSYMLYGGENDPLRQGHTTIDFFKLEVEDVTPPVISVAANPNVFWSPNHTMVPVNITLNATDDGTAPENLVVACTISSSQRDNGGADGNTVGDVNGQDGFTSPVPVTLVHQGGGVFTAQVQLRAERTGGTSRTYTINVTVTDSSGNASQTSTTVVVPISQGN